MSNLETLATYKVFIKLFKITHFLTIKIASVKPVKFNFFNKGRFKKYYLIAIINLIVLMKPK